MLAGYRRAAPEVHCLALAGSWLPTQARPRHAQIVVSISAGRQLCAFANVLNRVEGYRPPETAETHRLPGRASEAEYDRPLGAWSELSSSCNLSQVQNETERARRQEAKRKSRIEGGATFSAGPFAPIADDVSVYKLNRILTRLYQRIQGAGVTIGCRWLFSSRFGKCRTNAWPQRKTAIVSRRFSEPSVVTGQISVSGGGRIGSRPDTPPAGQRAGSGR